jgi:hypothetical protein
MKWKRGFTSDSYSSGDFKIIACERRMIGCSFKASSWLLLLKKLAVGRFPTLKAAEHYAEMMTATATAPGRKEQDHDESK